MHLVFEEKKTKQTQWNKFERNLKQAMKEMRLIEEGKLEGINAKDLFSEK